MKTFKDRIDSIIKAYHLSRAEFERICGLSNGYTRNLGYAPGLDKVQRILQRFPNINRTWLLNGEGEMFYSIEDKNQINSMHCIADETFHTSPNKDLLKMIIKKDEQIDRLLTLLERHPSFNANIN